MATTLDTIVAATRRRVAQAKKQADFGLLAERAQRHRPRQFGERLRTASRDGLAIIAELKKASPSRGVIRADFDPARLARDLAEAGASALSVLTDEAFFQGSLENLRVASANTELPCLRKDFVVDEFQVLESRANGADAILLIVAALRDLELSALLSKAREVELDVLCEVHVESELERALRAGCDTIGVNSRDLRTFQVDLETPFRLACRIPADVLRVAESGIHSPEEIRKLRDSGYEAFLIGEALMKARSPGDALRDLISTVKESAADVKSRAGA